MATQPQQLNEFSVGSILESVWDTATNTFKSTVNSIENAFMGGVISAQAQAQAAANQTQGYVPTVQVQGAVDTKTLLIIGGVVIGAVLLLRGK